MTQVPLISVNGFTIADLALVAPGPGQLLEVGGATEGAIDIDALAAYARLGTATESQGALAEAALQPSDAGDTGLALLAAPTAADARSAIGAMANTAPEIITNANGTAYRWPNGLQICIFETSELYFANRAWGALFINYAPYYFDFPAAFSHIPLVSPSARAAGGDQLFTAMSFTITPTSVQMSPVATINGAKGYLRYVAFGNYT